MEYKEKTKQKNPSNNKTRTKKNNTVLTANSCGNVSEVATFQTHFTVR